MKDDFVARPVRNIISNGVKLTNAVYNLLEYFPESDPLKNKAKEKALSIMSACGGSHEGGENSIQKDIDILLGYLEIAKNQGWINGISFLIVFNEYEQVKKEIGAPTIISDYTQKPLEPALNTNNKNFKLSDRQGKILDFLQQNQKAQVMDLTTVLPDVTKRTIRRDLDELLKIGKVVREGEFNQVLYKIA